jgi:O-succinylbenzoic acid--CoA ligase
VSDWVAAAAARAPDAPALVAEDGTLSYQELEQSVAARASEYRASGIRVGHRVALAAHPSVDMIVALHAAWRLGTTVVPLHPGLTELETVQAHALVDPDAVLSARGPELLSGSSTDGRGPVGRIGSNSGRVAAVVLTSGTRGAPRGVMLEESSFRHVIVASMGRMGLGPHDVWYAGLSFAHVGGLVLALRAAASGAALYVPRRFDPAELERLVRERRVSHTSLVPVMLHRWLDMRGDRGADRLKGVLVGGAAASPELIRRALRAKVPVFPTYGLTEACSQVATATPAEAAEDPGTVGHPLPGIEVRVAENEEILVRGPTVAVGYLGDDRLPVDAQGWLHTADLGTLASDGRLRVSGRLGDRILTGGVNVDPAQVERAIESFPGVVRACVIGVPDPHWGERVVALVESRSTQPEPEALARYLRERLSAPRRPKAILYVDELPLNRNGKVDRVAARRLTDTP